MEKRRFKFVIPVMVVVAISTIYMLNKSYGEVPILNKSLIFVGAILLSGIIAYFLFPQEGENRSDDRGPY